MDADALARLTALERDNLKIRGLAGELAGVVWGDMVKRDNGLRARVIALEAYKERADEADDDLRERLRHYLDAERRETCIGLAELARREPAKDQEEEEVTEVTVATIQAQAEAAASRRQTRGIIITATLNALGLIAVAIITRMPK